MDKRPLVNVTLIVPYYRNPEMLAAQVNEWNQYPPGVKHIVVDDGSPESARPVIERVANARTLTNLKLYRVTVDIPWNREGARNLAAYQTDTEWLIHLDIDHLLPHRAANALLDFTPELWHWYRFPRWRKGMADATRRKDDLPDACVFGRVKPHIDSYLMSRQTYLDVGGYDEDFAGSLGGGTQFLRRVVASVGQPLVLPDDIALHVYTRTQVADASDSTLSRDTGRGKTLARAKEKQGDPKPRNVVRFPWVREL